MQRKYGDCHVREPICKAQPTLHLTISNETHKHIHGCLFFIAFCNVQSYPYSLNLQSWRSTGSTLDHCGWSANPCLARCTEPLSSILLLIKCICSVTLCSSLALCHHPESSGSMGYKNKRVRKAICQVFSVMVLKWHNSLCMERWSAERVLWTFALVLIQESNFPIYARTVFPNLALGAVKGQTRWHLIPHVKLCWIIPLTIRSKASC